jgi:hypothetical protein
MNHFAVYILQVHYLWQPQSNDTIERILFLGLLNFSFHHIATDVLYFGSTMPHTYYEMALNTPKINFTPKHVSVITVTVGRNISYLSLRDEVLHPSETTCKVNFVYINLLKFLERRQEDKDYELNGSKHSPKLICLLFL